MADPVIYPRSDSGLRDANSYSFGMLGDPDAVTVHHSAGPRAPDKATCQALNRSYQIHHINQGWGDIGYHFCMDDRGRYYRLRPHDAKGAHVAGWNSNNIGIMLHGNYDHHELTEQQRESLKWLFQGGFYKLFGEPESGIHLVRGHQEWPQNQTACPGRNLMRHLSWLRNTQTY